MTTRVTLAKAVGKYVHISSFLSLSRMQTHYFLILYLFSSFHPIALDPVRAMKTKVISRQEAVLVQMHALKMVKALKIP